MGAAIRHRPRPVITVKTRGSAGCISGFLLKRGALLLGRGAYPGWRSAVLRAVVQAVEAAGIGLAILLSARPMLSAVAALKS
jgi:hypothetical protein